MDNQEQNQTVTEINSGLPIIPPHYHSGTDSPQIPEVNLTFTDNTVNDASTKMHGNLPKLSGTSTDVLHGNGVFGPLIQAWTFVQGGTFSVSVNTSLTNLVSITGLAGNSDYVYKLFVFANNDSSNCSIGLNFNGTSGSHWYWHQMRSPANSTLAAADGITVATPETAGWIIGNTTTPIAMLAAMAEITIRAVKETSGSNYRQYIGSYENFDGASSPGVGTVAGTWDDTTNELVSIQIQGKHSTATTTITGRYILYKGQAS